MRYFVVSDIHSFYTPLIHGLKNAGYDKNNENHTLVVLGDIFDRGKETVKVYDFLRSIPEERLVMVKGNHEYLLEELVKKEFPQGYDIHNCTVNTVYALAGVKDIKRRVESVRNALEWTEYGISLHKRSVDAWKRVRDIAKNHPFFDWVKTWRNYYIIDDILLVHAGVPSSSCWKIADKIRWERATWECPYAKGYPKEFKKIVVGHWHSGDFYRVFRQQLPTGIYNYNDIDDIFFGNRLIAIDGGVTWSAGNFYHKQNVLIIEDGKLTNGNPTKY